MKKILMTVLTGTVVLVLFLHPQSPAGKQHPTLVNIDSSNCTTCHDDLVRKRFVHRVVTESGCDTCHEMIKTEQKVKVRLTETGNALCFNCHDNIQSQSEKKFPHAALEEGCGLCHLPHSSDQPSLLKSAMSGLCAECHDIGSEELKKTHGLQPIDRLGCGGCHNPHGSDQEKLLTGKITHVPFAEGQCNACHKRPRGKLIRLRSRGGKLCYACHDDKEKEFDKASVHTPVKKGECSSCHDPHLADIPNLLKARGKAGCLVCHSEIARLLAGTYPHPPATEGCSDCHHAHASGNPFQLIEKETALCLNCHDASEKDFRDRHFNQPADKLTCSECHNPHGSNKKGLINTYSHAPFLEKSCDACHQEGQVQLTDENISDICLTCHDDKAIDVSKKDMSPHGALETDSCIACHSAHASSQPQLLKGRSSQVCLACHDDRAAERKANRFIHPVIDSIGCQACHESHFSKNPKLLRETGNDLCLACHLKTPVVQNEKQVTLFSRIEIPAEQFNAYKKIMLSRDLSRGHPQSSHPVSGEVTDKTVKKGRSLDLIFRGTLGCLSCHDAHAGLSPYLYVDNLRGQFQLCVKCHDK